MAAPIIGIDLGTANSCAAVADENGQVRLIPYRGGEFTVPSVVAYDDKGNELVGYEAKRQWQLNPKRTVHGAKRLVGVAADAELVQTMKSRVAYEIIAGDNNEPVVKLGNKTLMVPEISGKVLAKIKDVASTHLGQPVERAVVTVPAYYNDRQRQAVKQAGVHAGLEIVRIINEPTAAALAYGAGRKLVENVVIFDLGGGTFDVSVIEIRDRVFEVKATGGDVFLGGLDFDEAIIRFVLTDFASKHGVDLAKDPIALQRVRDMAERAKIDLSSRTESVLSIPFITMNAEGKPLDVNITLTRDELELLVEPMLHRAMDTCAHVVDDAKLAPNQIDQVLLVGGQTRMPLVQKRLTEFFGKAPAKSVHPDEAVAVGAALFAFSLGTNSDLKLQLLDVLPMAIGIETANGSLHHLFERNAAVPNRREFTFTTHKDNQRDLVMRLLQGDSERASDNSLLGAFTFAGLREGPAGSVRVEVVFDVSAEGILKLDAKDLDTGTAMQQTVRFDK